MTEHNQAEFEAIELQADATFLNANYKYELVAGGVNIFRNNALHLALKGEYYIMEPVACGICCTDCARPYLPYVLPQIIGHEVVVRIPKSIARDNAEFGVVEINNSHKSHGDKQPCSFCENGLCSQCPSRITMGINTWPGGLAKYIVVPRYNLYQLPPSLKLSPTTATLIEPFAAALHGVNTVSKKGKDYAVLGAGKLGLLTIAALNLSRNDFEKEITITAILRSSNNQEEAILFGADKVLITYGKGITDKFDVVFDTTGSSEGLQCAVGIAQREVHLKSTHGQPMLGFKHFTEMVVAEISLLPFSLEALAYNIKSPYSNANIYVAESVSDEITRAITNTNRNVYQNTPANADTWLENSSGSALLSGGSQLPRFDLAVCSTAKEVDDIVTPNTNHDRSLIRVRGAILVADPGDNSLLQTICQRNVRITTSRCGDFQSAISTLQEKGSAALVEHLKKMITHEYSLEQLPYALDIVSGKRKTEKKVLKVVLTPN
ncbi:hypothetical protein HDV01_001803 [Terramyces sp. JEL0728]|nr:hypothetical protein HDV01_001803 [Terramyces sp. JEL0728]